jgi:hypothetical protein
MLDENDVQRRCRFYLAALQGTVVLIVPCFTSAWALFNPCIAIGISPDVGLVGT